MALRPLPGYPQSVGAKTEMMFDLDGPASYVNGGTPATSGQTINAIDIGYGGIELLEADALSSDGLNYFYVQNLKQSTSADNIGNAVASMQIRWFVVATGAEVANAVNLSTKSIRVRARLV